MTAFTRRKDGNHRIDHFDDEIRLTPAQLVEKPRRVEVHIIAANGAASYWLDGWEPKVKEFLATLNNAVTWPERPEIEG